MSLKDVRETYYEASGTTSNICRQLAFAGIALVWILSGASLTGAGRLRVPGDLLWVGIYVVVALGLDLLQYAWRTLVWGIYGEYVAHKKRTKTSAPRVFNAVALVFFWAKFLAILIAYLCLLFAVLDRLD